MERLLVTRTELQQIADGELPASVKERAKQKLNPLPPVIQGQTDLEDMLADPN